MGLLLAVIADTAMASGLKECVPKQEGGAILTPKHGKCKRGYKLIRLGTEGKPGAPGKTGAEGKAGAEGRTGTAGFTSSELETLRNILPYIRYVASGVAGKPTVQFSGVNVQVVNGTGKTRSINGEGNLVIGYDENEGEHAQSGSNNLVLGEEQTFTSSGGLVEGYENTISAPLASVTAGEYNIASGEDGTVSGGEGNTASGGAAAISGGEGNRATEVDSAVGGGDDNTASGLRSAVSGGDLNVAEGKESSVSGGVENVASGFAATVGGGGSNKAQGRGSSVFGGAFLKATAELEALL